MSANSDHARPDFANVKIERFEEGKFVEADREDVMIVNKGKLGSLRNGLMHLADYKRKMARLPIAEQQQSLMCAEMSRKRREASQEHLMIGF